MALKRIDVVILIFWGVLGAGLFAPAILRIRSDARHQETIDKLKRVALAMHSWNDLHNCLPPAFDADANIKSPASVHVHLLEVVENSVYRTYLEGEGNGAAAIADFHASADFTLNNVYGIQNFAANLRVFSDKGVNTNYQQNMPPLSAREPGRSHFVRTFLDGTSNTIAFTTKLAVCGDEGGSHYDADPTSRFAAFIGQNAARRPADVSDPEAVFQIAPQPADCLTRPLMAQTFSRAPLAVALADGSVRTVSLGISAKLWNQIVQPNDGTVPLHDLGC